jgi:hypothetical protein
MQSTEVVESLQNIRDQVETHLRNVREYRAFLSIQAAMDEISHVGELHSPLGDVCEGVKQRLNELREYRALIAVEKSIVDISGVLGLLDEITPRPAAQPPAVEPAPAEVVVAEVAAAEIASETKTEEQPAIQQSEPAPQQPVEAAVAVEAPEALPVQAEPAVAWAPSGIEVDTAPPPAIAEIPAIEVSAPQPSEIFVPMEVVTDPIPAPAAAWPDVDHDVDSLRVALGTDQAQASEAPAPLVAAESNPGSESAGIGSEHVQEEPQQTVPEHDPAIAKVA